MYVYISNSAHLQLSNKNSHICLRLGEETNLLLGQFKTTSLIHDRLSQESFINPNKSKGQ